MGSRFIFLLLAMMLTSCNRPADYAVVGSAEVPSAHGEIQIEKIDKGQSLVTVLVDELPEPNSIDPELAVYVVWFVAVGEAPEPKCTLDYDPETLIGRCSAPTT